MEEEKVVNKKADEQSDTKQKQQTNRSKMGVVVGCLLLNVRATPTIDGPVGSVLSKGAKVTIEESKSTDAFYKISTKEGVKGFCMRDFIKVY